MASELLLCDWRVYASPAAYALPLEVLEMMVDAHYGFRNEYMEFTVVGASAILPKDDFKSIPIDTILVENQLLSKGTVANVNAAVGTFGRIQAFRFLKEQMVFIGIGRPSNKLMEAIAADTQNNIWPIINYDITDRLIVLLRQDRARRIILMVSELPLEQL